MQGTLDWAYAYILCVYLCVLSLLCSGSPHPGANPREAGGPHTCSVSQTQGLLIETPPLLCPGALPWSSCLGPYRASQDPSPPTSKVPLSCPFPLLREGLVPTHLSDCSPSPCLPPPRLGTLFLNTPWCPEPALPALNSADVHLPHPPPTEWHLLHLRPRGVCWLMTEAAPTLALQRPDKPGADLVPGLNSLLLPPAWCHLSHDP